MHMYNTEPMTKGYNNKYVCSTKEDGVQPVSIKLWFDQKASNTERQPKAI